MSVTHIEELLLDGCLCIIITTLEGDWPASASVPGSAKRSAQQVAKQVAAHSRAGADEADGESAVSSKISAMAEPHDTIGERLHANIYALAPTLSPKVWATWWPFSFALMERISST